ncbi:hypothetical protein HPP92_009416 [Vanilla planifolia]|uniref:SHSP domain-containing protein n=1 Tax=Vanilla planifolia TaxID=51239 RepID=A0A835RDU8_VANPL|nr:hypothetical protein HPP92_009633 [Vanilla planifolia]KAG0487321.1 hypothetical protein HPP92_009416 [Vanilla planifolia]
MADGFFGDPLRRFLWSTTAPRQWQGSPLADWIETPSAHIIHLDVPGLGKDDVKVQMEEGNVLHVKGDPVSSSSEAEKDAVWHVAERAGKEGFSRRFGLPDGIKAEQVRAKVENGVLTVVAPKEVPPAKLKPRAIPVNSKL